MFCHVTYARGFSDYVIDLTLFAFSCGITSQASVLSGRDTLSPSASIANKASAYALLTLGTHMRPAHKGSSPTRTTLTSHMPRAYAAHVET